MNKATLYQQLAPEARHEKGLSRLNQFICLLILLASMTAILETEPTLRLMAPGLFPALEAIFVGLFMVEYLLRLYAIGEDPRYRGLGGRLRYIFSFWALIDLMAILPYFMGFIVYNNAFLLRLLRLARMLRLARLGRFSQAWASLADALKSRSHELLLSAGVAGLLLLFSSCCLYVVEAAAQPEAFGSVPRALWWSIATLTTVGYGDVTPVTALGKVFAGLTAVAGIGLIAMPTGILAAAFSDAFQNKRNS
ncbi:Potassium voltage-gated channel subfamily KQT; possible potassium channel, VIC family [Halomonas citrativorans]|uniref:Potassium channel family protein n=1 Tax=Halomonas citrativorans TaxID=2742612 RepID=A0A1R4HYN2_9GAMM|nr:potassium channel family protein [Halomonas citrativorans]MBE0402524.1 potassium channel family protein [Halomonas citrativorans]SJN12697.1 Potassium voltage-gated channel subfamily KQT; possible potassium channel, VIC family [Halomonas citrativorans]